MRLFIASPVLLDDYAAIKEDFKEIIEGTWVAEENLHMTWVFLGEMPKAKSTIAKMSHLSNLESTVEIAELGYFGRPPKIFFARAEQKVLYEKARHFKEAGFDLYRFKPHITLCRINTIHDYKAYKETLKTYKEKRLGTILPEISLYQSTLIKEGSLYERKFDIK
jgi:2'-5' RNA ligase